MLVVNAVANAVVVKPYCWLVAEYELRLILLGRYLLHNDLLSAPPHSQVLVVFELVV